MSSYSSPQAWPALPPVVCPAGPLTSCSTSGVTGTASGWYPGTTLAPGTHQLGAGRGPRVAVPPRVGASGRHGLTAGCQALIRSQAALNVKCQPSPPLPAQCGHRALQADQRAGHGHARAFDRISRERGINYPAVSGQGEAGRHSERRGGRAGPALGKCPGLHGLRSLACPQPLPTPWPGCIV